MTKEHQDLETETWTQEQTWAQFSVDGVMCDYKPIAQFTKTLKPESNKEPVLWSWDGKNIRLSTRAQEMTVPGQRLSQLERRELNKLPGIDVPEVPKEVWVRASRIQKRLAHWGQVTKKKLIYDHELHAKVGDGKFTLEGAGLHACFQYKTHTPCQRRVGFTFHQDHAAGVAQALGKLKASTWVLDYQDKAAALVEAGNAVARVWGIKDKLSPPYPNLDQVIPASHSYHIGIELKADSLLDVLARATKGQKAGKVYFQFRLGKVEELTNCLWESKSGLEYTIQAQDGTVQTVDELLTPVNVWIDKDRCPVSDGEDVPTPVFDAHLLYILLREFKGEGIVMQWKAERPPTESRAVCWKPVRMELSDDTSWVLCQMPFFQ